MDIFLISIILPDQLESGLNATTLYILVAIALLIELVYSVLMESFKEETTVSTNILTTLSNFVFSVLGNTMIVCSGG